MAAASVSTHIETNSPNDATFFNPGRATALHTSPYSWILLPTSINNAAFSNPGRAAFSNPGRGWYNCQPRIAPTPAGVRQRYTAHG